MVSRSLVLYVILLPLLAHVAADEAEEQIITEVVGHNPVDIGLLSSQPHEVLNPLPPAFLLHLLRSGALRPEPLTDNDSAVDSSAVGVNEDGQEEEDKETVGKRVFCNNFTGCGGRHRDRSRRQDLERYGKRIIPLLVKRPFCNSFGCYNGKRAVPMPAIPAGSLSPSLRARLLAMMEEARGNELEGRDVMGKRLFCNGYGGCRGGKRSLFSPWMNKMNSVVDGRR